MARNEEPYNGLPQAAGLACGEVTQLDPKSPTIISASRRTDIPAFYAEWFMSRIRASHCHVTNPFNARQVTTVSLKPEDVTAIVFWTRNARPMMEHLDELDARGYRYYFQYTITGYPRSLEPGVPSLQESINTLKHLAARIGRDRVVWRYDPILITTVTDFSFHHANFATLTTALRDSTRRVVVSVFDPYSSAVRRLSAIREQGVEVILEPQHLPEFADLMGDLASCAVSNGLEIVSCAEKIDLSRHGIRTGKCVDDALIRQVLHVEAPTAKDKAQRKVCLCVESKDIGTYNTCRHGCLYCYGQHSGSGRKHMLG